MKREEYMNDVNDPTSIILTFGRYDGIMLKEVANLDKRYTSWLITEFVTQKHKKSTWLNQIEIEEEYQNDLIEALKLIQCQKRQKSRNN